MEKPNKTERYKQVAAVLLMAVILASGGLSLWVSGRSTFYNVRRFDFAENWLNPTALRDEVEENIHYQLPYRMEVRDVYSGNLVPQGKRETGDFYIIRDNDGFLHQTNLYQEIDPDIMEYAKRLRRMQTAAEAAGTSVLFVGTSGKFVPGTTQLPAGYQPDHASLRNLDEMFLDLLANQVETLDLRYNFDKAPLDYADYYYRTDSKWTARAAQFAAGCIAQTARDDFGLALDIEGFYADLGNYDVTVYPGLMQGDYGRTAGIPFGGTDDFVVVAPGFETDLSLTLTTEDDVEIVRQGAFSETVLDYSYLGETGPRYNDPSSVYYGEDMVRVQIQNNTLPDGEKLLMLCDENFFSTASYLALMCAEVEVMLVGENSTGRMEDEVAGGDYSLVLVACQAQSIGTDMFPFFES